MILSELQNDPAKFQSEIYVPIGSRPQKFGSVMCNFQRRRFRLINPSLAALSSGEPPPIHRIWDERSKGSSKDTDHAINLLWLLAFSRRPLRIQIGAYDQQQADEIRLIVKGILRIDEPLNNFLSSVIEVQTDKIINRRTDSIIEILTSDKLGSHGARPDVVLIDELTHQRDKGFAETLLDNLDKMPNGLGIIATNAGFIGTWQESWKKTFSESPRWKVLEFKRPAPWISRQALAESQKRNSTNRYNRLWRGLWVGDVESALDHSDVDRCITQAGPMSGGEKGWLYFAGVDLGIRKHASALVVLGRHVGHYEQVEKHHKLTERQQILVEAGLMDEPEPEFDEKYENPTHRLRVADVRTWKPRPGKRVSLEAVKRAIIDAHQQFKLAGIALDPHQAEHLIELLERADVPALRTPQTTASLQDQATALIESIQERTLELYQEDDLITDLKSLQVKDNGQKIRLVSPERDDNVGTAHGDTASALSFAIALARNVNQLWTNQSLNRKLITYP